MKKFKALRVKMLNEDFTGAEVAERAGMHPNTLSSRLTGRAPFTSWEIEAIAKVLDIAPTEYYLYFFDSGEQGGKF